MIGVEDRLAIRELLALYGYIIDERQFSRTGEIFTAGAIGRRPGRIPEVS